MLRPEVLISIVIPTYRRPGMLAELLPIVVHQMQGLAVEAIVVDNDPGASARPYVETLTGAAVHYLHEARSGVVHARNTGVAAATGTYVLFLDDDEVPAPGWLASFYDAAESGVTLAFGRIVPRYATPPAPGLEPMVAKLFSRDYSLAAGSDIAKHYAELGTGNALFERATCLGTDAPFDDRFNNTGGEDIWLIKPFADGGTPLVWVPGGLVEELVPADRMTGEYLAARRFTQGQLRCRFSAHRAGGADWLTLGKWMAVGAAQMVIHGSAYVTLTALGRDSAARQKAQLYGGLGKVAWWYNRKTTFYAQP